MIENLANLQQIRSNFHSLKSVALTMKTIAHFYIVQYKMATNILSEYTKAVEIKIYGYFKEKQLSVFNNRVNYKSIIKWNS